MRRQILINKTWARKHEACPDFAKPFFQRYPRGLRLTRANLLRAAETEPSEALHWFTWYWLFSKRLRSARQLLDALQLLETSRRFTRSVVCKKASTM